MILLNPVAMMISNFGQHKAQRNELLRVQLLDASFVIGDLRILDAL